MDLTANNIYYYIMKELIIKDSCNGKGCSIRTIDLAHDSRINHVFSEVHGKRDDIQKVLSMARVSLHKVA